MASWYNLFADLDPLGNPDALSNKKDDDRNCWLHNASIINLFVDFTSTFNILVPSCLFLKRIIPLIGIALLKKIHKNLWNHIEDFKIAFIFNNNINKKWVTQVPNGLRNLWFSFAFFKSSFSRTKITIKIFQDYTSGIV